jgi:hypothetical protein
MRLHCENAIKIAEYLKQHESIKKINYYPGLQEHPQLSIMNKMIRQNDIYPLYLIIINNNKIIKISSSITKSNNNNNNIIYTTNNNNKK